MTWEWNDIHEEDVPEDGHIPQGYLDVQTALDRFVEINYDTAGDAVRLHSGDKDSDANYLRRQVVDIIRNNPPLASVPKYFRDGRVNYLWYSDFYDDAGKDVFRQYGKFVAPAAKIIPANYAVELAKIDLPYFKELVNLISLEKLYTEAERRLAAAGRKSAPEETAPIDVAEQATEEIAAETSQPEPLAEKTAPKRSYEPKLSKEQYELLAECVETIKLFRRPVKPSKLKQLLKGKLDEPLQVANQNSLTYLLDQLGKGGYIKEKWTALAVDNKDFLSFRRGKNVDRYGSEPHYITMQQFSNCRYNNEQFGLKDYAPIEEMIEKMNECTDK